MIYASIVDRILSQLFRNGKIPFIIILQHFTTLHDNVYYRANIEKYCAAVHDILARSINNLREQITAGFIRDNALCVAHSRFFRMHSLVLSGARNCSIRRRRRRRHHRRRRPFSLYSTRIARNHLRFITVPFSGNFVFHRRWQPTTTWIQSALTDDEFLDQGDHICISPRFHARGKNSALE